MAAGRFRGVGKNGVELRAREDWGLIGVRGCREAGGQALGRRGAGVRTATASFNWGKEGVTIEGECQASVFLSRKGAAAGRVKLIPVGARSRSRSEAKAGQMLSFPGRDCD